VAGIPDKRWLPYEPGLLVLVTGGSGVVAGLPQAVTNAATDGLRELGITTSLVNATQPMTLALQGPAARDANRLAVSLVAASEELPKLSYFEELDPPMPHPTVRPGKSWTGSTKQWVV